MQQTVSTLQTHELSLSKRERLWLSGVEDVLNFDEEVITCRTDLGDLVIEGSSLRISDFSSEKGTLSVLGTVNGLYYEAKKEKKKGSLLFGRLRQ